MTITYHIVAGEYFRDCDSTAPYTPEGFADEGFIHCTDGEQHVADTANRYYRDEKRRALGRSGRGAKSNAAPDSRRHQDVLA